MDWKFRSTCMALVLAFATFAALIGVPNQVSAAVVKWTSDTEFNVPGAQFLGTEVVGTGPAAQVQTLRDGINWVNMGPSPNPGSREGPGLAFSTNDNVAVMFGGWATTYKSDTWEYSFTSNTWTQISTSTSPPARERHAMSYDPVQNVVVMYGGTDGSVQFTDTWEYDVVSNSWTQTTPGTSPPEMSSTPLTYHASTARHILNGWSIPGNRMETWAYNAGANTWTSRGTGQPTPTRMDHMIAYNADRDRTVLFGGAGFMVVYSDTWEYDDSSGTWTQMSPASSPPARAGHAMTYQPSTNSVLLFGGRDSAGSVYQETYRYRTEMGSPTWTSVSSVTKPPSRQYAGLTYETVADVAILYAGSDAGGNLGDTWSFTMAYRSFGRYISDIFDAGQTAVDWARIYWNRTSQPSGSQLRFQLAASNNIGGPFFYGGPDGLASSYYTNPLGETIYSGIDNMRYLKFSARFDTSDTQVTAVMEDITIEYYLPDVNPWIVITSPYNGEVGVDENGPVHVQFSEPMDVPSVSWTILMGPPRTLTPSWSGGNTILDLTPSSPFQEGSAYRIQIDGQDTTGNTLIPNPTDPFVVNPWIFLVRSVLPNVTYTYPVNGSFNIGLRETIIVDFSEQIDTSSAVVTINPPITLSGTWSNGDKRWTLTHTADFTQCKDYVVLVEATDMVGNPLEAGMVANPWTFRTICVNPYITATNPSDYQGDVALNAPVVVDFVEPMNTGSVSMTIVPDVTGKSFAWTNGNRRLTMTHSQAFAGCKVYKVTVTGNDPDGNPLIPNPDGLAPNPWRFMSLCPNPYMMFTSPQNGVTGIPITQPIEISFNEPMDTAYGVAYTVTPPIMIMSETWDMDVIFRIEHFGLQQCKNYTVEVTAARNAAGQPLVDGFAPNPWYFHTICDAPYLTSTDPVDGDTMVPLNKPIVVTFSEPMDPPTVINVSVPSVTFTQAWSNGDRTLTLTHPDFAPGTTYQMTVNGLGVDGNRLVAGPDPVIPNPWSFTTLVVTVEPFITRTDPANLQTGVAQTAPIQVEFSEQIQRSSFKISIVPSVAFDLPVWTAGDTVVTLTHSQLFTVCQSHTVTVSAQDMTGNSLINVTGSKPNPWSFTTICQPNPPRGLSIQRVLPDKIRLTWLPVPGVDGYRIYESQNRFAPFPWTPLTTTTFTAIEFTHLVDTNPHFYIVRSYIAAVESSNSTMASKIEINVNFDSAKPSNVYRVSIPYRSEYTKASDISNDLTSSRINVVAKWDPVNQRSILWYLRRGSWRGTDFTINPGDGIYIGPVTSFIWSIVGTDRAVQLQFVFNPLPKKNVNWISLPHTSNYDQASDIVIDIEGSLLPSANTKIIEVGKWDPVTQSRVRFFWTASGWNGGTDFSISAGEGVYLIIVSNFNWTPDLVIPEVP